MQIETQNSKSMECSKNSSKREDHNNTGLHHGIRKLANKQHNFTPKRNYKKKKKTEEKVRKRKEKNLSRNRDSKII